jgi:HEAT repeat protein
VLAGPWLWPGLDARGQAPGPELFAKTPTTPQELWDAADYLVRTGHVTQAIPYLNAFVQARPDDQTLLAIRDRFGYGSFLRLEDDPRTRPFARTVVAMLSGAQKRTATHPERILAFIAALTKSNAEQDEAVARLREAGPYAVPFLVQALEQPVLSPANRSRIVHSMGRLDTSTVPPLIATLDSPNSRLVADAAAVLGDIGDPRAVPFLTFLAEHGRVEEPASAPDGGPVVDPVQIEARRAIARLTGRPFVAQARAPIRVLTDEALRYHRHAVPFPAPPFMVWTWDAERAVPVPVEATPSAAEEYFGLRLARQALQLDPADVPAQVAFLSLMLEKAAERTGPDAVATADPSGAFAATLTAGPDVLARVARQAMDDRKFDLAAAALTALGQVTDRTVLAAGRRPQPLVEGLTAPDRRVQFAAARALVGLEPRHTFPGSSQVVPVLARFAAGQATPRAVVVDGNANRGSQLTGFLRELGYDPILASTGDDGFRRAAATADVELILIDNHLIQGDWRLTDTLANLRNDARTAGIPTYIVGPQNLDVELNYLRSSFPGVNILVTPTTAQLLEQQLGGRPAGLTPGERAGYAREAAGLLAQVATRPGSPFEPELSIAEPALTIALGTEATEPAAAAALGEVAMPEAQRQLADVLLDPARPAPVRVNTAAVLARSLQRFGPLLAADQEARLLAAYDQEADPALRTALAAALGALRPAPDLTGRRLQHYVPSSTSSPAPPPAEPPATPAPEATSPAPEAVSPAPAAAAPETPP